MYTIFYNFDKDIFIISPVNFAKDFYDDLEFGYINREGNMLVGLIIYNIHTHKFDTTLSYWLWRECTKLKYYRRTKRGKNNILLFLYKRIKKRGGD